MGSLRSSPARREPRRQAPQRPADLIIEANAGEYKRTSQKAPAQFDSAALSPVFPFFPDFAENGRRPV